MSSGRRGGTAIVEYLTCPLCGINRTFHTKDRGDRRFEVKPTYDIIQRRAGGGRGYGFRRLEGQGVKLEDLRHEFPDVYENLLREARRLLQALEEAGRGG